MIWILNLIIGKSLLNRNLIMKEYNKNYGKDGNLHKNAIFTKNGTMFALKLKASSVRAKLFKEKKFEQIKLLKILMMIMFWLQWTCKSILLHITLY